MERLVHPISVLALTKTEVDAGELSLANRPPQRHLLPLDRDPRVGVVKHNLDKCRHDGHAKAFALYINVQIFIYYVGFYGFWWMLWNAKR